MLAEQRLPETPGVRSEEEIIRQEVREIFDKVVALGEGNLAKGAVRSFAAGVLDVPFAPSRCAKGSILPARDRDGAIRLLHFGDLPLSEEIKEWHRKKIAERGRAEKREPGFRMVIDDIYAISKGMLVGKPR
jgi:methylaspartate mutase epsilon subunit